MNGLFIGKERRVTALLFEYWKSLKKEEDTSIPNIRYFEKGDFDPDIWQKNCFEIYVNYDVNNLEEVTGFSFGFIGEKIKSLDEDIRVSSEFGMFSTHDKKEIIDEEIHDICDSIVQNSEPVTQEYDLQYDSDGTIKIRRCFLPFIDDNQKIVKIIGALNYKIYNFDKDDGYEN